MSAASVAANNDSSQQNNFNPSWSVNNRNSYECCVNFRIRSTFNPSTGNGNGGGNGGSTRSFGGINAGGDEVSFFLVEFRKIAILDDVQGVRYILH